MKRYSDEVVVLEAFNTSDYKVLEKSSRKEIGFMLRKANAIQGFDLHAFFEIPNDVKFPDSAKTIMEGWAIFNRTFIDSQINNRLQSRKSL